MQQRIFFPTVFSYAFESTCASIKLYEIIVMNRRSQSRNNFVGNLKKSKFSNTQLKVLRKPTSCYNTLLFGLFTSSGCVSPTLGKGFQRQYFSHPWKRVETKVSSSSSLENSLGEKNRFQIGRCFWFGGASYYRLPAATARLEQFGELDFKELH